MCVVHAHKEDACDIATAEIDTADTPGRRTLMKYTSPTTYGGFSFWNFDFPLLKFVFGTGS